MSSIDTTSPQGGDQQRILVWDPLVRLFHWTVAIAFFLAWVSEDDLLTVHVWAGYTIGVLVVMRIAWGFIGPRHARFVDFVTGPWAALRYFLDLVSGRAERHLGHSPAGGLMVLALLAGLLATVWTGMEVHAIENNAGPLAAVTRPQAPPGLIREARADDDEHEEREWGGRGIAQRDGGWEGLHEALANGVLVLVVLHVLGVLLASFVHRENLASSMITGQKRALFRR